MIKSAPPSGRVLGEVPCLDALRRPRKVTVTVAGDRSSVTLLLPPGESVILDVQIAPLLASLLTAGRPPR